MDKLTDKQAKEILLQAQMAGYPNANIPKILAPLYGYIEQTESRLAAAEQRAEQAEAVCAAMKKAWEEIKYFGDKDNYDHQVRKLMYGPMACNREQAEYLVDKAKKEWRNQMEVASGTPLLEELEQLRKENEDYVIELGLTLSELEHHKKALELSCQFAINSKEAIKMFLDQASLVLHGKQAFYQSKILAQAERGQE